ncbi:MAG: hypothetical protein ACJ0KD_03800 [Dehalococcoidia bacterium]
MTEPVIVEIVDILMRWLNKSFCGKIIKLPLINTIIKINKKVILLSLELNPKRIVIGTIPTNALVKKRSANIAINIAKGRFGTIHGLIPVCE